MKAKTFDCVEMKHRGAEKLREQTKDMTPEQEVAFWRERSRILSNVRQEQKANSPHQGRMRSNGLLEGKRCKAQMGCLVM